MRFTHYKQLDAMDCGVTYLRFRPNAELISLMGVSGAGKFGVSIFFFDQIHFYPNLVNLYSYEINY